MRTLALTLLCLSLPASAAPRLRLLASLDGGRPSPGWVYARVGQRVTLHAELVPAVPGARLRWYKVEPTAAALDNTQPSFHFEPVPYARTEVEACRDRPTCPADVEPVRVPPARRVPETGTMAYQLEALLPDGRLLSTPGPEARQRGGLSRAVQRVTFRRDDTYLGYLTELFNTPYIFGSAGPDGDNQTDNLVGSDCADLAVYGQRRLGRRLAYISTFSLETHARPVTVADAPGAGGRQVRWGPEVGEVAPGDLLHFPATRHVAVLYEDRPPLGVLDEADLMLHTCWAPPTLEPIGESRCASWPIRVLRFRKP